MDIKVSTQRMNWVTISSCFNREEKNKMEAELTKTEEITELKFTGELTIFNIKEIKDKMIESLCAESDIRINHDEVTEVDITYLQLLKSFCYTADKKNLEVIISDNKSDVLKRVLEATGIHNFVLSENQEDKNE